MGDLQTPNIRRRGSHTQAATPCALAIVPPADYAETGMHSSFAANRRDPGHAASRRRALLEIALIFLVLFIEGAWPAPEANEPHYLSKARHYWDASWCAGDFFCNSADAHQVFYWTFGWLTQWLSFVRSPGAEG